MLRASPRPRKRQTAAPAPLRLFLPQAAPQLRSPARVGGSPLSLAALAGVSPAPLALSRFLRRALVSACKNRSAAPLTAPCFVRWTRSLFVPPEGEPSLRPWTERNFVVRRSFFIFSLPQTLSRLTQVHLPPPAGAVEPTASSGRNREAKLAQRSTFHKGIHARWEKWLSARGGGTALCAVTERGASSAQRSGQTKKKSALADAFCFA